MLCVLLWYLLARVDGLDGLREVRGDGLLTEHVLLGRSTRLWCIQTHRETKGGVRACAVCVCVSRCAQWGPRSHIVRV